MSGHADSSNGTDDEPSEEEQVETEWHFWLFAILATAGFGLLLFPPGILPEMGYLLIGLAVVGWVAKTVVEKGY